MGEPDLTPVPLPIEARMKVIHPLLSTGPSTPVRIIQCSYSHMSVRVPSGVFLGAMVHLRTSSRILVGEVRYSEPVDSEYEIHVRVDQIL
jgi:hypothetical protein